MKALAKSFEAREFVWICDIALNLLRCVFHGFAERIQVPQK